MVKPGRKEPNPDLAHAIIEKCFHKGLLLFAPVGAWGQTVKIAPPLSMTAEPLEEGVSILAEAVDEAVREQAQSSTQMPSLTLSSIPA
jgi:4-aminobutyrate aminotransferase-like enzyme